VAGKYADITPNLKPEPVEDAGYQGRVEAMKTNLRSGDEQTVYGIDKRAFKFDGQGSSSLAHLYKDLRVHKAAIDDVASALNLLIAAAEQMITEQWEAEGLSTIKMEKGGSVSTQSEPVAKVVDHTKMREWCVANGYENLFTLAWTTLNSMVKQRLLDGRPEPDGVDVFSRTKVVLRKT
jgi:hypothetical protein